MRHKIQRAALLSLLQSMSEVSVGGGGMRHRTQWVVLPSLLLSAMVVAMAVSVVVAN